MGIKYVSVTQTLLFVVVCINLISVHQSSRLRYIQNCHQVFMYSLYSALSHHSSLKKKLMTVGWVARSEFTYSVYVSRANICGIIHSLCCASSQKAVELSKTDQLSVQCQL